MGLIDNLLKPTPLYGIYQKKKQRRAARAAAALEAKYHPLRVKFYQQFLRKDDVVFDVGANVGNRVQAFLECEAKVIAVEPQPQCASILREKFGQQITIEQVGLGAQSGSLEMLIATDSTVSTFNKEFAIATKERFKFSRWQETIQVPIRTLDTLIKNHGMPRYCKIDVEGFELEVLKGLTKPIPLISIEYCVPEFSESMIACIHRLNEIASSGLFNYSIGESMAWALPEWMTFSAFLDHVQTKEFNASSFGDIYFKC